MGKSGCVGADQHQRQGGLLADSFGGGCELGGIAGIIPDGGQVHADIRAHAMEGELLDSFAAGLDLVVTERVRNQYGYASRIVEGFVMAEHDGFLPDGELALGTDYLDEFLRRSAGGTEGCAGFFGHVRARVQALLSGSNLHGKSQAGWKAAVLAVGFW